MDKKIKLLSFTPNKTGVGYYRSIKPHTFLDEYYSDEIEVTIADTMELDNPEFGKGFDIIQFHSNANVDKDMLIMKIKQLNKIGIKFVMDLDDYWMLPNYFPQYKAYNQQYKIHEKIIEMIRIVNYVTTTTSIFAKEISKFNKNVFVIPNAIDGKEKQFQRVYTESDKLRVGIICGSSHEKDIDILNGLVNQLKSDLSKIQFVICGFDLNGTMTYLNEKTNKVETRPIKPEETVWYKYEKILTNNYSTVSKDYKEYLLKFTNSYEYPNVDKESYRRCWTKPVNSYATHYNSIDVLLVPLVENKFNSMKSQLKAIEAGFFNKVIIAQDFGPYQLDLKSYIKKGGEIDTEGNALLVETSKNHKQWAKYIKFLLSNPNDRNLIANNLSDKIMSKYSLEEVSKIRMNIYKNILS